MINEQEKKLVELTRDLWHGFLELNPNVTDLTDMEAAIHQVQRIIMARMAARENPTIFRQ